MNGLLIVFSAPSGAGKTTIINALRDRFPGKYTYSISATTRLPRKHEKSGVDYYFLSEDEFAQKIENNEFVEWAPVHTYRYGTLKSKIEEQIAAGEKVIFDLDVKGALAIKEQFPKISLLIFIAPVSIEVLKERLQKRGTETEEQIRKRLERYVLEMEQSSQFDHLVVNDDLDKTVENVISIVLDFEKKY